MLSETIKKTRMYSGITQAQMAKALFMSEAQYNRKENGQAKISLREAKKIASLLELNERVVEKFWMADRMYELMKKDKDLVSLYNMEPENCYTIGEICKKYRLNDSSVWAHIRKYSIPSRQIGNYVYVPKKEIDKLYKSL